MCIPITSAASTRSEQHFGNVECPRILSPPQRCKIALGLIPVSIGTVMMPSISGPRDGCGRRRARRRGRRPPAPINSSRRSAVMASCSAAQLGEPFGHQARARRCRRGRRRRCRPRGSRRRSRTSRAGRPRRRPRSSSWSVLGLARVADDEVGPEGGLGLAARMASMRARNLAPSPQRRMRRSSGGDTCCSERSK